MSQHIHGLKPGDKLAIKGPIMKIPYKGEQGSGQARSVDERFV